jgi:hypothetical protein
MRLAVAAAAVALVAAPAASAASLRAVLVTPRVASVNVRWSWSVKVTSAAGKPLAGRVTVTIKDPLGGIHPIQFFKNTKNITNIPFKGRFADAVLWPPDSRGYPLTFRVLVVTAQGKRLLTRVVTVR